MNTKRDRAMIFATRPWLSADLDSADREALVRACGDIRSVSAGTDLVRQGGRTPGLHILLAGWAACYKIMENGSRFLPALAVPGDICNLDALRFDQPDCGVTMLSAGTVAVLPREQTDALFASHPAIAKAFWALTLAENSILTEWAVSMGRRPALQRVAHLLCELLIRLAIVGKSKGHAYELPLTLEHIADTLGLTPVHVNRTLRSLRSMGLVTVRSRRVEVHDWSGLSALGGFQPGYLHLETVDEQLAPVLPITGARSRPKLAQLPQSTRSASSEPFTN